ncbi:XPO5 protein, partial [Polypterus senegalus]
MSAAPMLGPGSVNGLGLLSKKTGSKNGKKAKNRATRNTKSNKNPPYLPPEGVCPILEEEGHIKDVLSRIVVEIIKREWPQHWPDMLRELESLTKLGEVQTELVMFVLLRVAEDVVTFQTLPAQRRRDIQQTLSQYMDKLFGFFLNILQQNVNKYRKMAKAHCRVGIATLNTLAGYIDWVALNHITSDNCRLLEMLCLLLSETELQLEAAECLLIAVSRKGSDVDIEIPNNYGKYLEAFLAFTTHPSQVGFPSKYDSPSCEYSRMDFDGDEDFNAFFNSFRAQQGEVIRSSCKLVPMEAFHMAGEWLHYQLNTSIDVGPTTYDGVKLLQEVLNYETRDPLILSCVLTNVSTFFPFVKYRTEFLPQVLSKLFASVTFEVIEESKPCFDMLYNHVKQLFSNEMLLTQMEKCALMEALVLVSNQFKCYEKQKIFLEELMGAVSTRWLSGEMTQVLSDPGMFVSFVGADQTITDPITDDPCGINRSRISFCVYTILGVVKRARWPRELEEAKAGGFVVGYAPNGNPIFRNPCSEQVGKLLDNLLALIRTHNNLFSPENSARLSETFSKAFDMMEVEKNAVLGLPQPLLDLYDSPVYKTVLERMQGFFCTLYDNCYHILGNAGPSLEQDFYNIPSLAEKLVNSAFINLVFVPDYRLRPMLHILSARLNQKWQILNQKTSDLCDSEESLEEGQVSQEMLEEQLLRLVTREVVDLICVCCIMKKGAEPPVPKDDLDEEEMMATDASHTHASDELTELGKCLLKHEVPGDGTLLVIGGNLLGDAVSWFFISILRGLHVHGQHEGCSVALTQLAFVVYEALRPRYSELKVVMEQIPNIQKEDLVQFDMKLMNQSQHKISDKKRKDYFKRLISGSFGKPLGQQFKKEVHIKNLPSLFKKTKPEAPDILDTEKVELSSLFTSADDI